MSWFRVDDGWWSHPKTIGTSLAAKGLWVTAGSWCSQHLTDGFVPRKMLRVWGATRRQASELVEAGLWESNGDDYVFHDWSTLNPVRKEVLSKRQADAERKRDSRRSPPDVHADKERTPGGLQAESEKCPRARSRDPGPAPPVPKASKLASSPAEVVSRETLGAEDIAREWHAALNEPDGCPGLLHALGSWRADYETVAAAINASDSIPPGGRQVAAHALCRWFWLAPTGPVQAGRIQPTRAKPDVLAKHVSTDLESAAAWWRNSREAAE